MLDEVGDRVDHARHQNLVLGDARIAEYGPLMRVTGIGGLKEQRLRPGGKGQGQHHLHRHIVMVRTLIVAPADVQAQPLWRAMTQRMVQDLDVPQREALVILEAFVLEHGVSAEPQIR